MPALKTPKMPELLEISQFLSQGEGDDNQHHRCYGPLLYGHGSPDARLGSEASLLKN